MGVKHKAFASFYCCFVIIIYVSIFIVSCRYYVASVFYCLLLLFLNFFFSYCLLL